MKRLKWVLSSIILMALVTACVTLSPDTTDETTSIHETAVAAASTSIVQTMTAFPTSTVMPTDILSATISTARPTVTPLQDFEPTQIPGLLQSALTVETLSSFNGHSLQRIGGWDHGFKSFEWLDAQHLLLYPFAGVTSAHGSLVAVTYPVVINRNSKNIWIPHPSQVGFHSQRPLLYWSPQLGALIVSRSDTSVDIFSPDGIIFNSYQGELLGVSPSATKILVDGDTLIDLRNGETVDFAWYQTYPATEFFEYARSYFHPIWSPDEMRVYSCCYLYGDARTSTSYGMPYNEITIDGKKVDNYFLLEHFYGTWVLDDTYLLPIWGSALDGSPNFIPLFDPATKTYRNLSAMIGLPNSIENTPMAYCGPPSAKRGGRYIWVYCKDGGHLIDLVTFQSQTYPIFSTDSGWPNPSIEWSADEEFAWLSGNGFVQILSVNSEELKPLPEGCYFLSWHLKDDIFACLSIDGQSLFLIDAKTVSIQKEIILPIELQEMIWSSDGKRIALLARDSSLWQVDYPMLENLEQLTIAMPEWTQPRYGNTTDESLVKNVLWSPNGVSLAFIGGADIYVVDTVNNP